MNQIAIIGLGYVGLPLSIEFGKLYPTVGYDIDQKRIAELKQNIDRTLEIEEEDFSIADKLQFTSQI